MQICTLTQTYRATPASHPSVSLWPWMWVDMGTEISSAENLDSHSAAHWSHRGWLHHAAGAWSIDNDDDGTESGEVDERGDYLTRREDGQLNSVCSIRLYSRQMPPWFVDVDELSLWGCVLHVPEAGWRHRTTSWPGRRGWASCRWFTSGWQLIFCQPIAHWIWTDWPAWCCRSCIAQLSYIAQLSWRSVDRHHSCCCHQFRAPNSRNCYAMMMGIFPELSVLAVLTVRWQHCWTHWVACWPWCKQYTRFMVWHTWLSMLTLTKVREWHS